MTKKHATYYTDADTRQSLIDIGMKAGAKEGRAASLGLRISAACHGRLVEVLKDAMAIIESDANTEENYGSLCRIGGVLAEIEGAGK